MSREYLDQTLIDLKEQVVQLEAMVSHAALEAVDALLENDPERAKTVYLADKEINAKRFEIENECLITIATQQPLATDLRELASILEISTELERMGDYAKGIAKISLMIDKKSTKAKPILLLQEMTDITVDMMKRAVDAFVEGDAKTAREIPLEEDNVDLLYQQIYTGLVEDMMAKNKHISLASQLQWAAHHIERMADRVINICERTIFVVTGEMNELEESDDEWVLDLK
jgi:phosphate transport system protein